VLPEAAESLSWPIFGALLAGLLVLLFVPQMLGNLTQQKASPAAVATEAVKKPNIKLK
jgi:hypothetical protein